MPDQWQTVYDGYIKRGETPVEARYQADQWYKRQRSDRWQHCASTHCTRRQECASPRDCCASIKALRDKEFDEHVSAEGHVVRLAPGTPVNRVPNNGRGLSLKEFHDTLVGGM